MRKLVLVIAVIIVMAAFAGCLGEDDEKKKEPKITYVAKASGPLPAINGHTSENEETSVDLPFNETYITQVSLKLTWTDTNDAGDPESAEDDTFTIEVIPPNGTGEPERKSGMGNQLVLTFDAPQNVEEPIENGAGWKVKITIDPGEGSTGPGLGIVLIYNDGGNDWTLNMEYKYLQASEETT